LPIAGVAAAVSVGEGVGAERCGWWRRWFLGLGRWWARLGDSRKQRRPGRPPVQTAFLLESVKVMRNDLVDADLELLRESRRRRGQVGRGKAGTELPAGTERHPGLGRVAMRWITAGRTD
jgi:hypothetical protein